MASLIYNSTYGAALRGAIDFDTDTINVLLTTSGYTENKDTHTTRINVTNEVAGTGYATGGIACVSTVTVDTATDRIDVILGTVSWGGATITARKAVYYKARGGSSASDELVAVVDFGGDVTATGGTFTLTASTLRIQN